MNQNSNFPRFGQQGSHQYGLSSFDVPAQKQSFAEKVFGSSLGRKLSSPLFATCVFLLCGVAFAVVIISAYQDEESDIPVVKAETVAFKQTPDEPGGMNIPNRDSTVFSVINGQTPAEAAPIENLLSEDQPADKLAAFARQVEDAIEEDKATADESGEEVIEEVSTMAKATIPQGGETPPVTLQKIEPKKPAENALKVAEAAPVPAQKPDAGRPIIIHKAGESPDTLEFVKSVLEQKDGRASPANDAARVAAVQPAAGDPTQSFSPTSGDYYVQLGSVKSLDGAEGEWGKIKKTFAAELGRVSHRVKAADLGERGTFYRIQAGPMSKASANEICDSIKTQKPDGCLVTR